MKYILFGLVSLVLLTGCDQNAPPPPAALFNATDISGVPWGKDFKLTDHTGRGRRLNDFRGKVVALFFGYTHCPDVCPTTLSAFAMALKLMGKDARRVQVLFVTVDPERDTPALLAQYVPAFNPDFLGLYTDSASLAKLAAEYKVVYRKSAGNSPQDYLIDHTAGTFVYDPQGRLRLLVSYGSQPKAIAQDLIALLQEQH
ncbi:MAG: SCO family protein [Thiobacillaceae bacterium]